MGGKNPSEETLTPTEQNSKKKRHKTNDDSQQKQKQKETTNKTLYDSNTTLASGDVPSLENFLGKNKIVDGVFGDSDEEAEKDRDGDELVSFGLLNGKAEIKISPKVLGELRHQWKNSLIVKLFGKTIEYDALCSKAHSLWNLEGGFKALDLGENYFLFKFENFEDRLHVYTHVPYVVMDHLLSVRKWEPNFIPSEAQTIMRTAVWVRFRELPVEFLHDKILHCIAKSLGRPIKVDHSTQVNFARVCVEIDLSKPLCPVIEIEGKKFAIEYESLHSFCFDCSRFGHIKDINCDGATILAEASPKTNKFEGGSKPMEENDLEKVKLKETENGNNNLIGKKNEEKQSDDASSLNGIIDYPQPKQPQKPPRTTFWTSCHSCRRKYLYHNYLINQVLLCPRCKKTFTAHEIKFQPPVNQKQSFEKFMEESNLIKLNPNETEKGKDGLNAMENGGVTNVEANDGSSPHSSLDKATEIYVRDPDFNDFDKERGEDCFKVGNYWALYSPLDAMPRIYCRISRIISRSECKLSTTWLDPDTDDESERKWVKSGLPVSCGNFKKRGTDTTVDHLMLSHQVDLKKGSIINTYKIYPQRGRLGLY